MSDHSDFTRMILGTIVDYAHQDSWPGAPQKAVIGYMVEAMDANREDVESQLFALEQAGEIERFEDKTEFADETVTKLTRKGTCVNCGGEIQ